MDSIGWITLLGIVTVVGVFALGALEILVKARRGKETPPPAPEPAPSSVSLMAGLSFFSGLSAILLATVTGLLTAAISMGEILLMDSDIRAILDAVGKIVLYVSLLPAVAAIAFALGARGVISESRGTVRGRPLYRTGVVLALLTGGIVLQSASGFSATEWTAAHVK